MRQLEVVAVSEDGTYVLLAGDENAARPTHALRIDHRLHAAIRNELEDDDEAHRESELTPKEIQARLRAGDSIEEVAREAKISLARVQRYAGPVMSERERVIEQARAAVLQRSRGPQLSTPLGEVVDRKLAETAGLKPETVEWSARRREDGAWVVSVSYRARGGARVASWLWSPADQELTSLGALGTRVGADEAPAGRRRSAGSSTTTAAALARRRPAKRAAAKRGASKRAAAKRAAAKRTATKRAPAKRAATSRKPAKQTPARRTAKRTAAKRTARKRAVAKRTASRSPAKRTTAKRAPAKRVATTRAPAKGIAPSRSPAKRPPAKRAPAATAAKRASTPRRRPPRPVDPPVIESSTRRTNGRVSLPSWSDVLIGVQVPAATRSRRRS